MPTCHVVSPSERPVPLRVTPPGSTEARSATMRAHLHRTPREPRAAVISVVACLLSLRVHRYVRGAASVLSSQGRTLRLDTRKTFFFARDFTPLLRVVR